MNIEQFAALVEAETKAEYIRKGYTQMDLHYENGIKTVNKPGKKYTKVNVGTMGKFMVVNETGEIFGIKAYGVIHKSHQYGTLETTDQWHWGDYSPCQKVKVTK